ncbi:MAG: DEAD/DEAH box helicase [Bacteroidales bacterium]|nr:DEAD/DEAH box helicase [Bacteroidales bacterium]
MIKFEELGLSKEILQAISEMGFVHPTPIQEKTIPALLNQENDLIALAQTGTGKTAGFGLPIIDQINTDTKNVQAVILCPTRELCIQISNDLESYSKYTKSPSIQAVYGGASIENQIKGLKKGANIVVGTPGRTLDLIKRKALKIDHIQWLVLDEADEMLNMGFREELDDILQNTPETKQTLLFSATMPNEVRRIAYTYMHEPEEISVGKKNSGAENISHHYYMVKASDRYQALKRVADINPDIYGIVFCRTRMDTKDIASKLINDGYSADALHGDLSQAQRDQVMDRFRRNQLQLLVATDVAARGIDVNDLTHVINYNLPDDPEVYVHRTGRTGRAGKQGVAISICHARDGKKISAVEKATGKKFEHKSLPTGEEICEKRLYNLMDKIERIEIDEEQIAPYWPAIHKKLDWLDRDELLKRFVSVEFNRFLDYYKNAGDINVKADRNERNGRGERSESGNRGRKGNPSKFTRFFINIGSTQRVRPPQLIGLVNDLTNTRNITIGSIEIMKNFSFFEADSEFEGLIMKSFRNAQYNKEKLSLEIAKPKGEWSDRDKKPKDKKKNRKKRY